jgi:transcriptional regulator with XRE-family HTH domain
MSKQEAPFSSLGKHLKYVREQSQQSLAEVSGAVEIEEMHLERIEAGLERPPEDVLLLLISHFGVKDREAVQLWESAEYDTDLPDEIKAHGDLAQNDTKPAVMLLAMDMRAIYSDGLDITVNPAGLTLNFTQNHAKSDPIPVARVGMSLQQAQSVVEALQKAMLHVQHSQTPKLLPPPKE